MSAIERTNKPIKWKAKTLARLHNDRFYASLQYDNGTYRFIGETVTKLCKKYGITQEQRASIGTMKIFEKYKQGLITL